MSEPPDLERLLHERRAAAEARATRLAADLAAVHEASRDSNADDEHDPEGATIAFERQQLVALLAQARSDVADTDRALARVAEGPPRCESCGTPIPAERLAVRPAATACVRCAAVRT